MDWIHKHSVDPFEILVGDVARAGIPEHLRATLSRTLSEMVNAFRVCHFTYMETNPLVITEDLAVRVDPTAAHLCKWEDWVLFPDAFGQSRGSMRRREPR